MGVAAGGVVRLSSATSPFSSPCNYRSSTTVSCKIHRVCQQASSYCSCLTSSKQTLQFSTSRPSFCQNQSHLSHSTSLYATLNSPRGFGPPPKKSRKTKKLKPGYDEDEDKHKDDEDDDEDGPDAGVIPEVVTNRMMSRMGVSVGVPLFIGLLFFPFFYYLKVGLKIDVPTWVPFIVSFFFFGSALLGVSYGIVSSSWDPMREGSFWGWKEAQKNWPVFWQSFWGRSGKK